MKRYMKSGHDLLTAENARIQKLLDRWRSTKGTEDTERGGDMNEWCAEHDINCPYCRIKQLEAERDRYREALEHLREWAVTNQETYPHRIICKALEER